MSTVNSIVLSGPRWLNLKMSSGASGMVMAEPLYGTVRTWTLLVLAWPTASGMEEAHAAQEDDGPEPPCPETREARGERTAGQLISRAVWLVEGAPWSSGSRGAWGEAGRKMDRDTGEK